VKECELLPVARKLAPSMAPVVLKAQQEPHSRGLHSSTCQLNVSAWSGMRGAFRGFQGVFRGC